MLRAIAGVIVGYLVMAVLIFGLFTTAYFAMGAESAFAPGVYDPSPLWLGVSTALGMVAAISGGWVCAAIARSGRAVTALAVLVLVLGVLTGIPSIAKNKESSPVRTGDVSNLEAMMQARSPAWVMMGLNPVLGFVGAMIGGKLRKTPQG